jgi:hypothetical protein
MSARLRDNLDRKRRAQWARRIAADQRLAARRAAATLQTITRQFRSIQIGDRTRLSSVGTPQGAGVVTAVLPNGRRTRMRLTPTMALLREVNRLRSAQTVAIGKNSRAIAALAVAYAAAVKKLSAEQVKSDRDLRKRLVEADNRLNQRMAKELSGLRRKR